MKTLLLATGFAVVLFSSCNKCAECHYDYNDEEIELGEFCGDDLEAIENDGFHNTANDTTYEVHCHEH
ncbi:hypothetical protein [Putridiphycobacter roseus]|nr:hypothetical protein [Putridiphycobacter roseus]